MTKLSNNFTGNIDDLLNHCASVDDNTIDQALELERAIEHVMSELDMNREEAMETIQHIHLMEVQQTVNSMMEKGLLEITGYNENDEPLYTLTELGKSLQSPDA
jgi:predicted transcriptional regulator